MTVNELIDHLKRFPGDHKVYVSDSRNGETDRIGGVFRSKPERFESGNILNETAEYVIVITHG